MSTLLSILVVSIHVAAAAPPGGFRDDDDVHLPHSGPVRLHDSFESVQELDLFRKFFYCP